ncbi:MAG: response regulator [Syntrophobacteraceae bacterium]
MADDDQEDCLLATEALSESGAQVNICFVEDGIELIEYLLDRARSRDERLPGLILLDLNMPRKDGREALAEIKAKPALKDIPIVILTTSEDARDIELTMEGGAESFLTKPDSFEEWVKIMKSLTEQWLS